MPIRLLAAGAIVTTAPQDDAITARRADGPIVVDGRLVEAAWRTAAEIPLGYEVRPRENAPAGLRTACRVAFDDQHLYVGCEADDPVPSEIRAWYGPRDAIDGQDHVRIDLDPHGDARRAYRFAVSALGVIGDAVLAREAVQPDASWDGDWHAGARASEGGYQIEVAIPFRELRAAGDGRPWAISIARVRPRDVTVEVRNTRVARGSTCELCQYAALRGVEIGGGGGNLRLAPTVTAARSDARGPGPGGLRNGAWRTELGADALVRIGTATALALTVNPDFSQVEADAVQLDANARFALAFPERRPFFLESADLFRTGEQIVFTRSIADPSVGAKLVGTRSGTAFALLAAVDEATNLVIPGPRASRSATLAQRAGVLAARVRQDAGDAWSLGATATSRAGRDYGNHVVASDVTFRPSASSEVVIEGIGSVTRYPDSLAARLDQPAGWMPGGEVRGSFRLAPRDWVVNVSSQIKTRGLRLDAGFQPQAGTRALNAGVRRRFWGDGRVFTRFSVATGVWRVASEAGAVLDAGEWIGVEYNGPRESSLSTYFNHGRGFRADGRLHDLDNLYWFGEIRPARRVRLQVEGWTGTTIEFASGRRASQLHVAPAVDLRVGRHLELRAAWLVDRYADGDTVLLTEDAAELRGAWHFTPSASLRVILQRHAARRGNVAAPGASLANVRDEALQVLYTLRPSPQTLLLAGYSAGWFGSSTGGDPEPRPESRGVFVKLGYAWHF